MQLRRRLFARGYRYRVGYPVPGMSRCSVDIAFPRAKVAVFVDGCFWHSCPLHGSAPKANAEWWERKLKANADRDRRVSLAMERDGWKVVRVWEHERLDEAARRVETALADALRATTESRS